MNASVPVARRRNTLSSSLGLGDKLFSSGDERRFVKEIEDGLDVVEEGLLVEMSFADDMADVTSRYLLEAGGKRVRPLLTLLSAQLGDGNHEQVFAAAKAIEITHLASLYHDDVMDESTMRRGVPTAQAVWGNSVAILTGDLLFARASKLVAGLGERVIRLQADTFERLCLGQLHETIGPRDGEDEIAHYIQVLADKTGSLIAAAAEVGVVTSNAPEQYRVPVVTFGEKIGVAFQLIDDIIDLAGDSSETGKVPGTDLRAGVSTLPLLYLRQLALTEPGAAELLGRIERDVSDIAEGRASADADADLDAAIAELREHEVTARTLAEARRWAREAVAALEPLPDGPVKKSLTRFADTVVERSN
ncbi:heptaprenyl diphosphate synthase [Conyzicola nivalis]|uniref:Heptaprenyl diphosphate synthase n=1 Tax=Conyzicola nivalis TaxID=1477021 RepID=A0ABV2QPW3_9MICO